MQKEFDSYEKLSVTTDIVVLTTDNKEQENKRKVAGKGLQALLIKRDEQPYNNMWSLPGGFVNPEDKLTDCVERKLQQKTGLKDIYKEQLATYGDDIERDSRGRVISVAYLALTPKSRVQLSNDSGTKETQWFWIEYDETGIYFRNTVDDSIIVRELAFDHLSMIKDSIDRLKNKIMYTNVGFNLLDEYFTIKELQTVFEIILEKEVYGFRKLIMPRIEETDIWSDGKAHRPARLYKLRRDV